MARATVSCGLGVIVTYTSRDTLFMREGNVAKN